MTWSKRNVLRFKLPVGRRSTGRPRKRWRDNLPKDWTEARMRRKTGNLPMYSKKKKKKNRKKKFFLLELTLCLCNYRIR